MTNNIALSAFCVLACAAGGCQKVQTWKYEFSDVNGIATLQVPEKRLSVAFGGVSLGGIKNVGTIFISGPAHQAGRPGRLGAVTFATKYEDGNSDLTINQYRVRIRDGGQVIEVGGRRIRVVGDREIKVVVDGNNVVTVLEPPDVEIK